MQDRKLLKDLIDYNEVSTFAEIGVLEGITAFTLLDNCPSIKQYYAIDPWVRTTGYAKYHDEFEKWYDSIIEAKNTKYKDRLIVIRKFSKDALADIEDNSLDMVFLDASHYYEEIKHDILEWEKKVRVNGILSGHDYSVVGVKKALNEVFGDITSSGVNSWYMRVS